MTNELKLYKVRRLSDERKNVDFCTPPCVGSTRIKTPIFRESDDWTDVSNTEPKVKPLETEECWGIYISDLRKFVLNLQEPVVLYPREDPKWPLELQLL